MTKFLSGALVSAVVLGVLWFVLHSTPVHSPATVELNVPSRTADYPNEKKVLVPPLDVKNTSTELNLSGQGLTKAPAYIFGSTAITILNLSHNKIDGSLQAEIHALQNLRTLDLSTNMFTGVPAEIGQLSRLETLDLSNNKLTGLPYELGNLKNLKVLNLSGNAYSETDLSIIKKALPSTTVIITK